MSGLLHRIAPFGRLLSAGSGAEGAHHAQHRDAGRPRVDGGSFGLRRPGASQRRSRHRQGARRAQERGRERHRSGVSARSEIPRRAEGGERREPRRSQSGERAEERRAGRGMGEVCRARQGRLRRVQGDGRESDAHRGAAVRSVVRREIRTATPRSAAAGSSLR